MAEKSRKTGRSILAGFMSLVVLAAGLYVWNGLRLASSLFGDPFFAVAFSIIPLLVGWPLLVGVGSLIRAGVEKARGRRVAWRWVMPWALPVLAGLVLMVMGFIQDRSPGRLFRDLLNANPPGSLANFRYWSTTLPGDSLFLMAFDVDPKEFNALLGMRKFEQESDPVQVAMELKDVPRSALDNGVRLPVSPLVAVWKYESEGPPGLPHIVDVFATADRKQVVIYGDN